MKIPFLKKIKNSLMCKNSDQISLNLWGLTLCVDRDTSIEIPTELSVIIPRVELRHKYSLTPFPTFEKEIIMNSITVVLSPRYPTKNNSPIDNACYLSRIPKKHKQ
ncbi:MAG: hypothetical protein CVU87_07360 [Firmicutes bacterium HGW-Firmicutes-12]|jgi:hypothetical protein|nr:MAG: hypothetical protein CVU87_07360 [Firmicutes bacterium HGW-Firmicutes-12]